MTSELCGFCDCTMEEKNKVISAQNNVNDNLSFGSLNEMRGQ